MAPDLFVYAALGAGLIVGQLLGPRRPSLDAPTVAAVLLLVFFLGAELSPVSAPRLASALPAAFGASLLLLGATAAVSLLLARRPPGPMTPSPRASARRFALPVLLSTTLVAGWLVGQVARLAWPTLLDLALYALVFVVAIGVRLERAALRRAWAPVAAAGAGAAITAGVLALLPGIGPRLALATAFGFGWYTLAGPLVTTAIGPVAGLFAFLVNFLRENLTMLTAPIAGPRLRGEGIAALGGATAMDTTLYFVGRYGGRETAATALASGLVLTVSAGLLVPLLLSLPFP